MAESAVPPTHIVVEGDKPKVEQTRKRMKEDPAIKALEEKFGSVIQLSVRVLRPSDKYPYERQVWSSEIRVPVADGGENVQAVVTAWIETMDAGIALAKAFGAMDGAALAEEAT